MIFSKTGNIYIVSRVTGSQDNILGVCFSKNNDSDIEVIQWNGQNDGKSQTSKEEVLKQVISGLKEVNKSLGTNYTLSKIYFLPLESAAYSVYEFLIAQLIRHYHTEITQ